MSNYGIYVAGATTQTVEAVTSSILAVLDARGDQETIRHALDVLAKATSINNMSISNCCIDMTKPQVDIGKFEDNE